MTVYGQLNADKSIFDGSITNRLGYLCETIFFSSCERFLNFLKKHRQQISCIFPQIHFQCFDDFIFALAMSFNYAHFYWWFTSVSKHWYFSPFSRRLTWNAPDKAQQITSRKKKRGMQKEMLRTRATITGSAA